MNRLPPPSRSKALLLAGGAALLAAGLPFPVRGDSAPSPSPRDSALTLPYAPVPATPRLSNPLVDPPDWVKLEPFQETVSRSEFLHRLDTLYAPDADSNALFRHFVKIDDGGATFYADEARQITRFRLRFASDVGARAAAPPTAALPPAGPAGRPLAGWTICLDPGHIGGAYAKMEERWFQIRGDLPILEAQLNLWACRRAAAALEAAGAKVVWTKTDEKPVTPLRPDDLHDAALKTMFDDGYQPGTLPPALLDRKLGLVEEKLFYRVAEIQARAKKVAALKPDLTLCVHFNAAPWGQDLSHPSFVPTGRLVVFVHGQYMAGEVQFEDERYDLVRKLLEQSAGSELKVAERVAERIEAAFPAMPPEAYKDWPAVRRVGENPALYARNLLASRLFRGPVVFAEGPYMNADDAYPRLQAGDYDGERLVAGKMQRSVFADYGEAIAQGVIDAVREKDVLAPVPLPPPAPAKPASPALTPPADSGKTAP